MKYRYDYNLKLKKQIVKLNNTKHLTGEFV